MASIQTIKIPPTMRAVEIAAPGGPDVLRMAVRPVPELRPREVLIQVVAAGVNRPDVLQRLGKYPPPEGASDLPGLEVSGTVVALGDGAVANELEMGQAVCALLAGGGYAEFVAVPVEQVLPIPDGVDLVHAAGIPETCFTVWTNVFDRGDLKSGETFLVHGGTSGIGTTAIQLARARGARVFATAGSDRKCGDCVALGAERAINYRTEDFAAVVDEVTAGWGVDVILDMVGGSYLSKNIESLCTGERLVFIAFLGDSKTAINLAPIMMKRLTVTGSTLRARSPAEKGEIAQALRREVWPLFAAGTIRPMIYKIVSLEEAADAHRLLEIGEHVGKIILRVR
ncbi:MAG TPA: NAD(P)H-quinone oxidoreductase [Opitutaceae bacterium]